MRLHNHARIIVVTLLLMFVCMRKELGYSPSGVGLGLLVGNVPFSVGPAVGIPPPSAIIDSTAVGVSVLSVGPSMVGASVLSVGVSVYLVSVGETVADVGESVVGVSVEGSLVGKSVGTSVVVEVTVGDCDGDPDGDIESLFGMMTLFTT